MADNNEKKPKVQGGGGASGGVSPKRQSMIEVKKDTSGGGGSSSSGGDASPQNKKQAQGKKSPKKKPRRRYITQRFDSDEGIPELEEETDRDVREIIKVILLCKALLENRRRSFSNDVSIATSQLHRRINKIIREQKHEDPRFIRKVSGRFTSCPRSCCNSPHTYDGQEFRSIDPRAVTYKRFLDLAKLSDEHAKVTHISSFLGTSSPRLPLPLPLLLSPPLSLSLSLDESLPPNIDVS